MPLNFLKLQSDILDYADSAAARGADLAHKLQDCLALLGEYNQHLPELQQAVEEAAAQNKGLRCAEPVAEFLTSRKPVTLPAPPCTIFAADGSQINPDPHGETFFGLVNVGIIRIQPGSGKAPTTEIYSSLLGDEELYNSGGLASEDLIALMRDTREREILASLVEKEAAPVLTLTDGPLELYHEPRQEAAFKNYFEKYLNALDHLALNQVTTAGYVDRPRADLVVKLLELMVPEKTEERPFKGVSDLSLYETLLQPGERSAIFKLRSSSARAFEGKKELHFFYLNVGSPDSPALARVEVPLWVAEDQAAMQALQAVLVEQSALSGSRPYPYPLIRAHETAVVRMDDRQQVTQMLQTELLKRGFQMGFNSNKQFHKQHGG